MKGSFKKVWICQECETKTIEKPENDECLVCREVSEINEMIDLMSTKTEYRSIKARTNKMEDSIPKFNLFNRINRLRKDRNIES